jgi:hypothetical protein
MSDEPKSDEPIKGAPVADNRSFERRSAQAMVATFLQMGRSVHLARWLHQARQRSLEKRVREAKDMKDIVGLQQRLDAQQSQAAVVEQAAERFRNRARELAQFAKAGLTMDDFHRMGVEHVVDMDKFAAEVAQVQRESAVSPASPSTGAETSAPASQTTTGQVAAVAATPAVVATRAAKPAPSPTAAATPSTPAEAPSAPAEPQTTAVETPKKRTSPRKRPPRSKT